MANLIDRITGASVDEGRPKINLHGSWLPAVGRG